MQGSPEIPAQAWGCPGQRPCCGEEAALPLWIPAPPVAHADHTGGLPAQSPSLSPQLSAGVQASQELCSASRSARHTASSMSTLRCQAQASSKESSNTQSRFWC